MIRYCKQCGQEFKTRWSAMVLCSEDCRRLNYKQWHRAHYQNNKSQILDRSRQWYFDNYSKATATRKAYYVQHRLLILQQQHSRSQRVEVRERNKANKLAYYAQPGMREKNREYLRQHYSVNKIEHLIKCRAWAKQHPEIRRESVRKFRRVHPEAHFLRRHLHVSRTLFKSDPDFLNDLSDAVKVLYGVYRELKWGRKPLWTKSQLVES